MSEVIVRTLLDLYEDGPITTKAGAETMGRYWLALTEDERCRLGSVVVEYKDVCGKRQRTEPVHA